MLSIARLPRLLFDPRGRADRLDMLLAAVAMVGIEAFLTLSGLNDGTFSWAAKGVALWICIAVSGKRLRDMGYSAWWLLAGAAVICIWSAFVAFGFLLFVGPDALSEGSLGLLALVGVTMMPAIGLALWLHLAEGEARANRFGPVTGAGEAPATATQAQEA